MQRRSRRVQTALLVVVAAGCFLLGVRLLGSASTTLAPTLGPLLRRAIRGPASALGVGWVLTYGALNGSVVAAVAVTLNDSGLLPSSELFAAIVGSRFGASAVVILLGLAEYVQERSFSLRDATSLGVLSAVVTFAVYGPVALVGLAGFATGDPTAPISRGVPQFVAMERDPSATLVAEIVDAVGPVVGFALAIGLVLGSFRLFDRILAAADTDRFRDRVGPLLGRPALSALVGFGVTFVTTSVAFSVGVLVPLYNRGFFERDELVPYLLGASVGTLGDTLLVAVVLGSPVGIATVVLAMLASGLVSIAALATGGRFTRSVCRLETAIRVEKRNYVAFVLFLLAAPTVLVLFG
ncbi:sodium:phosphate symporter [Haloarchaeobius sp. DFWS5]|uniref:sodium:phosphate symporter n=1 Tax=Haloarchaeobius sp. DFWS5 TaxID=3446114 RepID=UPI003EBA1A29